MNFIPFYETSFRMKAIRSFLMPELKNKVLDLGTSGNPLYLENECDLTTIDIEPIGQGKHIQTDLEKWKPFGEWDIKKVFLEENEYQFDKTPSFAKIRNDLDEIKVMLKEML